MQEPIEAKNPQLFFESKLYRILQGGSKNHMPPSAYFLRNFYGSRESPLSELLGISSALQHWYFYISVSTYQVCIEFNEIKPGISCPAGILNTRWYGLQGKYRVLVMDLLGPTLEDLKKFCSQKFSCSEEELARFSLKTVLILADQLVSTTLTSVTSACPGLW